MNTLKWKLKTSLITIAILKKKEFKVIAKKGPKKAMDLLKKQIVNGHT